MLEGEEESVAAFNELTGVVLVGPQLTGPVNLVVIDQVEDQDLFEVKAVCESAIGVEFSQVHATLIIPSSLDNTAVMAALKSNFVKSV